MTPVDKGTREELVLVRSFDELRLGMLVVYRSCSFCNGQHRGMLLRLNDGPWVDARGDRGNGDPMWELSPTPSCTSGWITMSISRDAVANRKVYRVVDGLEKADELVKRVPVSSGVRE